MFVVFDLDGTLADADHRNPLIMGPTANRHKNWEEYYARCEYDPPVAPIIALWHALECAGHRLEIWTGRSIGVKDKTITWLARYGIYNPEILMRPLDDHRPDTELKGEWLATTMVRGPGKPDMVIEDRTRMINFWRSMGIIALQCAPGDF